ncbi:putative RING-H2 finger protein ATL12 [Prosopis cineraria]|uniref:putative RING-H2 finger protein ATL12 n=1 Tax=Prosopis cineraria TaxID=364024 RepID=UPI00240FC98E|nr:putative RING-H2 finger protein ATL12 [Prosopis cineraria]
MSKCLAVLIMILSLLLDVQSQGTPESMQDMPQTIHPSKGIIIAILTVMFGISFLLLAYVKFCKSRSTESLNRDMTIPGLSRSGSRYSGIDKQVIEALPFFKFSSLKGSKEGLECAVCLSKFDDAEVLRLLPKCKHAFHMNCIDKWLECHSTCPLCRYKVDPGDIKTFNSSISSRFLRVPSDITEVPDLEIFVQREQSSQGSSIFDNWKPAHRLNHKIVISDVATRSRWSDLNSSDLLSLNSEILSAMSSATFSASNEEDNSFTLLNAPGEKRSMSEIANVARFAEISVHDDVREERVRRIWLPIVERTLHWFAGRESNTRESEHKGFASNV